MLDRIGRGVDESHGVAADRNHRNGFMVGGEAHAVDEDLSLVQRAEIAGLRIAEPDDTEQPVVDRIGHRDGVGKLLRRINPVAMADRDVRIGRRCGRLAGPGCCLPENADTREKMKNQKTAFHVRSYFMFIESCDIAP